MNNLYHQTDLLCAFCVFIPRTVNENEITRQHTRFKLQVLTSPMGVRVLHNTCYFDAFPCPNPSLKATEYILMGKKNYETSNLDLRSTFEEMLRKTFQCCKYQRI